jgi:hypothetical protein
MGRIRKNEAKPLFFLILPILKSCYFSLNWQHWVGYKPLTSQLDFGKNLLTSFETAFSGKDGSNPTGRFFGEISRNRRKFTPQALGEHPMLST